MARFGGRIYGNGEIIEKYILSFNILNIVYKALTEKLQPQLYELGFLKV